MRSLMKLIKWGAITLLIFAAILFTAPFIFKAKLVEIAKTEINKNVNAQVDFGKFSLSFFTAFPNLNFVMHDLSIIGEGEFEAEPLAKIKKLEIRVGLLSLNSDKFSVKSIRIDQPKIHTKVLKNGKSNWDIAKISEPQVSASQASSEFKLNLEHVLIKNGAFIYEDKSTGIKANLKGFWAVLSGDMSADFANLKTDIKATDFSFNYGGSDYVEHAVLTINGEIESNLVKSKYTFSQIETKLNKLDFHLNGEIEMTGDNIKLNLGVEAKENEFKNFLSVIPSLYNEHFTDLHASGLVNLSANINGNYNKEQTPGFDLKLNIEDGRFSYADLPGSVEEVNIGLNVTNMDGKADHTKIDLKKFHLTVEDNLIDVHLKISTPISDPTIVGTLNGKLDFGNLKNTFPMEGVDLSGLVTSDIKLNGRISALEEKNYTNFIAQGEIKAKEISYKSNDLPEGFSINEAHLNLQPQQLNLKKLEAKFGKSDFHLDGKLDNYLAYFFKDEDLKGNFNLHSNFIDLDELISDENEDVENTEDTTINTFEVPSNIDFVLSSNIKKALYNKAEITDIKGDIIIKDAKVEMKDVTMNMLDGNMAMIGSYETLDASKAKIGLGLNIQELDIKKTASTFSTLKLLAPIAEKCAGTFSASVVYYDCLLNKNMMPDLKSINAKGHISSKNIRLENSEILNKVGSLLKLDDLKSLSLKDIDLHFNINNGRVEAKPFDIEFKNLKATIQGVQNTDQGIDYLMQISLPKSELGDAGQVLNDLHAKTENLGVDLKASDFININAKITGHVTNPKIAFDLAKPGINAKKQATEKVDKAKQEAILKAEKQAVELMTKADEKAKQIKELAKASADKVRAEAEIQAKKIEDKASNQIKLLQNVAKKAADKVRDEAEKKATKIEKEATIKADQLLQKAKEEGDQLIETAKKL